MSRRTLHAILLSFFALSSFAHAADGWTDNMADAMKQAAAEKKDLLLDFTGSDWCHWCIKLHEEVFEKEPFKTEAPKKFVLVTLDFPQDKSKLSADTIKQNKEWEKKLQPEGYPTVFLTDEKGVPYAITGYEEGGPEKYLAQLNELAKIRKQRDEALAKAATAEGTAKAQALDQALTAVGEELALAHYQDLVKEVVAFDAENKAGLKGKYEQLLKNREALEALTKLQDGVGRKPDLDNFVRQLDEISEKYKPTGAAREQLFRFKIHVLVRAKRFDDSLKAIDEAAADKSLDAEARLSVLSLKIDVLNLAKRYDEGLKLIDALAADQSLDAGAKHQFQVLKVEFLGSAKRPDDALKLASELLKDKALDADERLELSLKKSEILLELKRPDDAIKVYDEILAGLEKDSEERYLFLAQKADALAALDRTQEAIKVYDEAIAAAPDEDTKKELKKEKRKLEKKEAAKTKNPDEKKPDEKK